MTECHFSTWKSEQAPSSPTDPTQIQHCFYCFNVLDSQLRSKLDSKRNSEVIQTDTSSSSRDQIGQELANSIGSDAFPLFVTWNVVRKGHHPSLRGCIGNFSPSPIDEGLKDYALISALKDHRFPPVSLPELKKLSCTVSLLHSFEDCQSVTDWTIGKHGIYIHLPDPSYYPLPIQSPSNSECLTPREEQAMPPLNTGVIPTTSAVVDDPIPKVRNSPRVMHGDKRKHILSATYLPDVALEQEWTQLEAIDSAIRKAGWKGPIDKVLRDTLIVERYQSSKWTATYHEFEQWRTLMGCPI
ncbi:AMMECR1 domain-containing protein [Melampsora americana]|nr:AMMECR1 domain-containing protein [Melampsora americana]